MRAAILVIGDEILNGDTLDTNSNFAVQILWANGISTGNILTVCDKEEAIVEGLDFLFERYDLVISTGGLGPTKDDVTKLTMARYFESEMMFDDNIYGHLVERYEKRGLPLNRLNRDQALVPEKATVIHNPVGTAPIFWFERNNKVLITLPGVPGEMRFLMERIVMERIKNHFMLSKVVKKNIHTAGISESKLAERLQDLEAQITEDSNEQTRFKLAYLPQLGTVKLQLTGFGDDEELLSNKVDLYQKQIEKAAKEYIYGYDSDTLGGAVGKLLRERNAMICTAESCTGGYLASLITATSGSGDYFKGGIVTYLNEVKNEELNVSEETLSKYTAVSKETAEEMLHGAIDKFEADYAIVTTGYAGPTAKDGVDEVGMVWIGVGNKYKQWIEKFHFNRDRKDNIHLFSITALNLFRRFILDYKI